MTTSINDLNSTMISTLKKLNVSLTMLHSPVSIISVTLATIQHLETTIDNFELTVTMLKKIVAEIRKNREVSTMIDNDNVTFNPSMIVTGTNGRLFPVYFIQKHIDKLPEFINPDVADVADLADVA